MQDEGFRVFFRVEGVGFRIQVFTLTCLQQGEQLSSRETHSLTMPKNKGERCSGLSDFMSESNGSNFQRSHFQIFRL